MFKVSKIARVPGIPIAFLLAAACIPARAQQGTSLADAARQARAQKAQSHSDNNRPQPVANELSDDQNDTGAPSGFKTYNAGDYKVWVPAPYHVDGHDSAGIVLSGPNVGSKHPILMLGTPIVSHWENDSAFQDAATQFSRLYAGSASCTKTTVASHAAYQCSMAAANLLGQRVSGNAVFVRGSGNIYPVFCVTPSESRSRDLINSARAGYSTKEWARETLAHEEDDARSVYQKCETVFQSIHLAEGTAPQSGTAGSQSAGAAKLAGTPSTGGSTQATNAADIARGLHQPNSEAAGAAASSAISQTQSTVPSGFKVHAFNYCKSQRECWDASVLVPSDAKLVSSDCKQYVFEIKVQEKSFLLMAGLSGGDGCQGRSQNDASLVRWEELVAPETARAPGTASTISDQQMTLDGKRAVVTKMRFKQGMADWIGKRAEVESNGISLVVGCMAPKEYFNDGDEICTALIGSLRLP
jgi:hypothetical protein